MNQDEYAKMYALEDHYWWFVGRRNLALGLVRRYAPADAPRVLDVGCGTGVVLGELEKLGCAVGLDFSPTALAYSAKRGLPRLVRGDGAALPLGEEAFDAVVGLDIFEHIPDDEAAFREALRVLRPGGVLVLSVPAFRSLWGPHDVALHHFRRYRRGEVRRKLEAAGFRVERVGYSVFVLFPLVVVTRILEKLRPGPAHASLPKVPEWLNRALIGLQSLEARWIFACGWDLPFGSSVVAVARKPAPRATPKNAATD